MKINDSGMPEQAYWNSLFDLNLILKWMGCTDQDGTVVEIGCGYGTFTVPVAAALKGKLIGFDIEQNMLDIAQSNAEKARMRNVQLRLGDVLVDGTGLEDNSVDRVMLFNILHFAERGKLLLEVERILKPGAQVDILHWRKDMQTPRGPQVDTRPDTSTILKAIDGTKLILKGDACILPPYHWGIQLTKSAPG